MTAALLRIDRLGKHFGGLAVSDGISLDIPEGEFHALIGPNGAGKTTLVQQITGALAPDSGRIEFAGRDITRMPLHARVMRGIARSYQVSNNYARFSVLDNIALALQARSGDSLRFWARARLDAARYAQAEAIAARAGLEWRLDAPAGALSHGEQRQLELALALAVRPRLLLLDEPMAGLGQPESERMVELLKGLQIDTTLLLIEHDMDTVFRLAARVSVLVAGRIVATDAPGAIRANPLVQQAYLGEAVNGEVPA